MSGQSCLDLRLPRTPPMAQGSQVSTQVAQVTHWPVEYHHKNQIVPMLKNLLQMVAQLSPPSNELL